jgi:hypothetical protein
MRTMLRERVKDAKEYGPPPGRPIDVPQAEAFLKEIDAVEQRVLAIEGKLYDIALTGAREDAFRTPNQLYEKLASVGSDVSASSADFRPTDQQAEVYDMLRAQLEGLKSQFDEFVNGDLKAFAAKAATMGLAVPVIF